MCARNFETYSHVEAYRLMTVNVVRTTNKEWVRFCLDSSSRHCLGAAVCSLCCTPPFPASSPCPPFVSFTCHHDSWVRLFVLQGVCTLARAATASEQTHCKAPRVWFAVAFAGCWCMCAMVHACMLYHASDTVQRSSNINASILCTPPTESPPALTPHASCACTVGHSDGLRR